MKAASSKQRQATDVSHPVEAEDEKKAQNRHRGEANTRRTRKHLIVLETRRQAREESGESNRDAFDGKNQVSTGIEPADPWYRTSKGRYRTGAGEEGVLLMPGNK